jgi:hypothetical protein
MKTAFARERLLKASPAHRPAAAFPASAISAQPYPAPTIARCACGGSCPQCRANDGSSGAVRVSEPGDPLEREADQVADQVMRMAEPGTVGTVPIGIQRKCTECEDEEKQLIQTRRMDPTPEGATLNPEAAVCATRRSGAPLSNDLRSFFEPRFGHNFSGVRLHAGGDAAEAAHSVQARAYTFGRDIVFGPGEYSPVTTEGKRLIAHELAHVIQQGAVASGRAENSPASSDASIAPAQISRQVTGIISRQRTRTAGPVNCPAGRHGAPADAEQIIDMLETFAILAVTVGSSELTLLKLDITLPGLGAGGGFTMPTGTRIQNYTNRFGLPSAAARGRFRNRLSGATFPSQAEALLEEVKSLQDRYSRITDFLGGSRIRFRCITNPTTVGGCQADCSTADAFGCPSVILLCPNFWNLGRDVQSQLLIHEVAHTLFGVSHGRNFRHADCYAAYAADARGVASPTSPVCVP